MNVLLNIITVIFMFGMPVIFITGLWSFIGWWAIPVFIVFSFLFQGAGRGRY